MNETVYEYIPEFDVLDVFELMALPDGVHLSFADYGTDDDDF